MLLNEVVLGKEMVLTKGDQTLKQASDSDIAS